MWVEVEVAVVVDEVEVDETGVWVTTGPVEKVSVAMSLPV